MTDTKPVTKTEAKPEIKNTPTENTPEMVLQSLKNKAEILGIVHSQEDTVDTLRERINAKLAEPEKAPEAPKQKTAHELRQEAYREATRLVRCRITNMNPQKSDLPGEILTVSNRIVGEIKRYIPYNENSEGWHVEQMLLNMMQDKKFQQIRTRKAANGQILPETKWVKEFAIEILPDLTPEELKILANKQAAAAGMSV